MAKGEFASFVKSHYDKVRHLPVRERLKALGDMYRGGKTKGGSFFGLEPSGGALEGGKMRKKTKPEGRRAASKGGSLLGQLIAPLRAMQARGGAIEETGGKMRKVKSRSKGGDLVEDLTLPMQLFAGGALEGGKMHKKAKPEGRRAASKGGRKKATKGAGLFSDALDALGPVGAFIPHLLGAGLPDKPDKPKTHQRVRGGVVDVMPMSLVPPSVPVDRASTAGVNVPSALYSGVKTFNPHEQAIEMKRRVQPKVMKQEEGTFIKQGASQQSPTGSDLKTIMRMFGMGMPKHMRNVPHGGKLSKKHLKKIYEHTMATHGKVRGGGFFDDMWSGFKQGFVLPFKAVGTVANAIL
jgi:hypothetical protein